MKKLYYLLLLSSISITSYADNTAPANLYKVNLVNKLKCMEYYQFKGDLYCSPVAHTLKPIDPHVLDYEKFKLTFDERPWLMAWGANEDYTFAVEYVPKDESLDLWHEMVTSQFLPGAQAVMSPRQYFNRVIESITNAGYNPVINVIEESSDEVIAEFQVKPPANVSQDEIQRIIKTDNGFYILHYAARLPDMGAATRAKWIANLKKAKIIDPNE